MSADKLSRWNAEQRKIFEQKKTEIGKAASFLGDWLFGTGGDEFRRAYEAEERARVPLPPVAPPPCTECRGTQYVPAKAEAARAAGYMMRCPSCQVPPIEAKGETVK